MPVRPGGDNGSSIFYNNFFFNITLSDLKKKRKEKKFNQYLI